MLAESMSDSNFAMLLAGFAAFASVTTLMMPGEADPRLQERMQLVARERDRLREKRLADLSVRSKRSVRRESAGILARLLRRFKAEERGAAGSLTARLRMAGLRGAGPEAWFLVLRAATPALFFAAAFGVMTLDPKSNVPQSQALALAIAAAAIGYSLPRIVLDRLIARRQTAILRAFPDALDLLLICVQSGMSVEAALAKVTRDIARQSIDLAEELSLTMAELSYLPARWRAYANLGERTGLPAVKLITAALVQAERHGASIGQALTAAAREGREARIMEAERKAAALPPLLAIPLVVFFLPVLLTIILGPALMQAKNALKHRGETLTAPASEIAGMRQPDARPSFPRPEAP